MAWSRADLDKTSRWLHDLERQRVGDGQIPDFVAAATSVTSLPEPKKPQTERTSIAKDTLVDSSRAQAKDAQKIVRQRERRAEKREQGDDWEGKRGSTTGRAYTDEHTQFIITCHQSFAAQTATMGRRIPLQNLTDLFNARYNEDPPRTRQSLSSVIDHKDQLKQMRQRYN